MSRQRTRKRKKHMQSLEIPKLEALEQITLNAPVLYRTGTGPRVWISATTRSTAPFWKVGTRSLYAFSQPLPETYMRWPTGSTPVASTPWP